MRLTASASGSSNTTLFAIALSLLLPLSLTGCGMGNAGNVATNGSGSGLTKSGTGMQGHVHGGNQPIQFATITIYLAGVNTPGNSSTGYGTGASVLASTSTDANGDFSFASGAYTCPTPAQQAYVVSSGGNPGLGTGVNNTKAVLMAALGTCPAGSNLIATNPVVDINEVTTVAAVWALQQFMAPPSSATQGFPNIGAPNTSYSNGLSTPISVQSAVLGMNNAFTTARIMADVSVGASPNTNYSYATPESAKINTLADIIAYCVNTDPSSTSNCGNLLSDATPSGSTTAKDTVQALYYMAQNPINNISNLYNNYVSSTPPFLPVYSAPGTLVSSKPSPTAFNDTTVAINYEPLSGGAPVIGGSYGIAIDAYGNVWLSNKGEAANPNTTPSTTPAVTASITEIGPDGSALLAPTTAYTVSTTGGSASKFPSGDLPTTARVFSSAFPPSTVAIDLANQAWFVNNSDRAYTTISGTPSSCASSTPCGSTLALFSASTSSGVAGGSTAGGYFSGYAPTDIVIDGSNNIFSTSAGSTSGAISGDQIFRMSATDGSGFVQSTGSIGIISGSTFLAIDTNPNVSGGILWVPNGTACAQPINGTGGTSLTFGVIGLYGGTSLAALADSEIGTSLDPYITLGAGTTANGSTQGNCNQTNVTIGQTVSNSFANPGFMAIDKNNGAWLVDVVHSTTGLDGLTYFTAPTASTALVPSSTTLVNGIASTVSTPVATDGTTLDVPVYPEVDGNNNVWVTSSLASVVEASVTPASGSNPPVITLLTPGQGSAIPGAAYGIGFQHNILTAKQLAIDASGNVWITNDSSNTVTYINAGGTKSSLGSSVTVIVGAAGPVITPRSLRIKANKLGQKP